MLERISLSDLPETSILHNIVYNQKKASVKLSKSKIAILYGRQNIRVRVMVALCIVMLSILLFKYGGFHNIETNDNVKMDVAIST